MQRHPSALSGPLTLAVAGLVFCALATTASAQPASAFTDRAAWTAATEGVTTVTFEGIAAPAQSVIYRTAAGLTVGGLTFVGTYDGGVGFYLAVADSAYFIGYNWGSGATLQGPALTNGQNAGGPHAKIRITLPAGTTAFGTDLMAFQHSDVPLTLTLSTGESFTQNTLGYPARAFLGVTSSVPIAYVDVSTLQDVYPELDNVSVGQKIFSGPLLTSVVLKTSLVPGCKPVTGTVTLSEAAPAGGLAVTLSDSLVSASVPAKVTVPAGSTSKTFKVTTTPVGTSESGVISATLDATTLDAPLTVRPISVASVTLTPNQVVGGTPVSGGVKLECKAQPGDIFVDLASSNTAAADPTVPGVLIAQGAQAGSFMVVTFPVVKATKANVSATANGQTKSKALKVKP